MIKKVIQIALASLLVFFVAAPVIVGVYDATNIRTDTGTIKAMGRIEEQSGINEKRVPVSIDGSKTSSGLGVAENEKANIQNGEEATKGKDSDTITDWYNCDPDISNSLAAGDLSLVYEFSDGSTVDFGNPYELYWEDGLQPSDYLEIVSSYNEPVGLSLFSPEKAYAGPGTWIWNKLIMLVGKSKYWESAPAAFYSLCISGCMYMGMTPVAAQQVVDKFVQRIPPIVQMFTKEGAVATEETALMVMMDAALVASRTGQSPAQIPALINQSATHVMNTGTLISGSSANFMNAWYQILSTNQVSANFIASNADMFISLFSFLGAELIPYSDLANEGAPTGTVTIGELNLPIYFGTQEEVLQGLSNPTPNNAPIVMSGNAYPTDIPSDQFAANTGSTEVNIKVRQNSVYTTYYGNYIRRNNPAASAWSDMQLNSQHIVLVDFNGQINSNILFLNGSKINFVYETSGKPIGTLENGIWTGAIGSYNPSGDSQPFPGQIIGADAEFDENGNLINPGNINVPDITAPGYVQPGSYQEALDQMHATATDNIPAKPDSPTFGDQGTIKDWIEANKPTPPGEESSQDDFKVQDLEKVFPFSIPWDLYYLLAIFAANPVAPNFNWQFDFAMAGKHDFAVDLAPFDPVAQVCRACETVLFCIGLALVTRNLIRG